MNVDAESNGLKPTDDRLSLTVDCQVFFSPSHEELSPGELADWILADRLPVRMQVQLHKVLWGDVPGR